MWYEHITLPRVLRCYKVQESVLESLLYAQLTYGFISVDLWILVKYICDQGYLSRPEYTDSDYSYYTLEKIKRYEFSHIGSLLIFNFYIVYNMYCDMVWRDALLIKEVAKRNVKYYKERLISSEKLKIMVREEL